MSARRGMTAQVVTGAATEQEGTSSYRVMTALRRVDRSLRAVLDAALDEAGITAATFHVMEELTVTPVLHAGELAWRLRITRQSVHGIVRSLIREGLVEIAPMEGGIRNLWLTAEGRDRILVARKLTTRIERRIAAAVPSADREALLRMLDRIRGAVEGDARRWWWE